MAGSFARCLQNVLKRLSRSPPGDVIVLAAAGGELLDDLDHLLAQRPGGIGLPLHGGIDAFRLQLDGH